MNLALISSESLWLNMSSKNKVVSISNHLYSLLVQKVKDTNFKNVDEYVEHILLQILHQNSTEDIDPKEEEKIKQRLEKLGYL